MKPRRTLPPAAPYQTWYDLWEGLRALLTKGGSAGLEREIAEHFGTRYAFAVSSGKAALTLILRALRSLSDRRDVVLPAYTCFAVVASVREAGLTVRPCDIEPSRLGLDPRALDQALTPDTLCVVPTHLFGIPTDVVGIRERLGNRVPFVVENAAQAMGSRFSGRPLGTLGDVGFFSLGRGKAISSGNGGIVLTDSPLIGKALQAAHITLPEPGFLESWREFVLALAMHAFIHPALYWLPAGLPFLRLGETILPEEVPVKRMSRASRGLLRKWRSRLDEGNDLRQHAVEYFRSELGIQWGSVDEAIPYIRLPVLVPDARVRERIVELSRERGLGIVPMYPYPIDQLPGVSSAPGGYPCSSEIARSLITIPNHHLMTRRDRALIAGTFRDAGFGLWHEPGSPAP